MSNETKYSEKEKGLCPVLRFKGFNDEWSNVKMSDMITFISGFAFESSKMLSDNGNYQLIKMSNVYKSELALDRSPSYWNELDERYQKVLLKKGDVILTLTGTVGKRDYGYSVVIPEENKFLLNQRLVCLRGKENLSASGFINSIVKTSHFLYHFFNESKGGTGNQSNVGVEDLKNIKVAFPTLPEQQKIASFLSTVDEKIQQLTRKKELLEQYKKGVMQQLFSGKLRFKDVNGKPYPKWEEKRLGEITNRNICYGVVQPGIEDEQGIKFIRGGDVFNGKISKNLRIISKKITDQYQRTYLNGGELVMSLVGYPGETAIVPKELKGANLSRQVGLIDLKKNINAGYVHQYLSSSLGRKNLLGKSIGSAQQVINIKDLKEVKVPIPLIDEQQKIASFLTALDVKIESVTKQITHTQTFKKGLLQQMFV